MARPLKESLDYFPLDIDFDRDDKLVVVIGKYGMQGLGIIVKIMMEIYRNGYFYAWGEREQYAFSNRINVDINTIRDVINECIRWDFFNQELYENHNILTSKGFQKRFIEAAKRRKIISILEDFLLIDPDKECEKVSHSIVIVNVIGNIVNEYINPIKRDKMSTEIPQSKVKESKVKESKEENLKELPPEPISPSGDEPPKGLKKGKTAKGTSKPQYDEENTYYRMAVYFKAKVDEMAKGEGLTHLTANTNLQSWANDFRLLVERDKHEDRNLIQQVMDWVVTDIFWKSNVLSAATFRDKFPKLVLEMRNKTRGQHRKRSNGSAEKTKIDVVPSNTDGPTVSETEYEEMMRLAQEMQDSKGGR